ncbi:MAG: hypothetical protein COB30_001390, partial [Ectothiorhodospiraceae bacterium]|nr:hypothetical protein [Ectothiorhodospiraceae bacterium]
MNTETDKIILKGPIDYLVFSKKSIFLEPEEGMKKIILKGHIVDLVDDVMTISIENGEDFGIFVNHNKEKIIKISVGYRSKRLQFNSQLSKVIKKNNTLEFLIPSQCSGILNLATKLKVILYIIINKGRYMTKHFKPEFRQE